MPVIYKLRCSNTSDELGDCQKLSRYDSKLLEEDYIYIEIHCSSTMESKSKLFFLFIVNFLLIFFFIENEVCPKAFENSYHLSIGLSCYYFRNFIKPISWLGAYNFCFKKNLSLINYVSFSQNKILYLITNHPFSPLILPISKIQDL